MKNIMWVTWWCIIHRHPHDPPCMISKQQTKQCRWVSNDQPTDTATKPIHQHLIFGHRLLVTWHSSNTFPANSLAENGLEPPATPFNAKHWTPVLNPPLALIEIMVSGNRPCNYGGICPQKRVELMIWWCWSGEASSWTSFQCDIWHPNRDYPQMPGSSQAQATINHSQYLYLLEPSLAEKKKKKHCVHPSDTKLRQWTGYRWAAHVRFGIDVLS